MIFFSKLLREAELGLHASHLPCPAPSPAPLEADQDSSRCNNASFMDVIFFVEFINIWYREFSYLHPASIILLLNLNLSRDCLNQGLKVGIGAAHCVQHLHHPSSPQKIPLEGLHTSSRHWCLPLWLPGHPMCSVFAAQVRSPCQGSQHCLDAHTQKGWVGRTLSLIRRIANPHGYIKLGHGARQEQQDKCLNVAVSAFVLTKAKSKASSEHARYLGINILSIFSWILKLVSGHFQGQLLCKLIIRQLFLCYKCGWRHSNYERTLRKWLR